MRPLRRTPRPRVPRRAHRHRVALLRQLLVADLRAGTGRHPVVERQRLAPAALRRRSKTAARCAASLCRPRRGGATRPGRARRRSRRPRPSGNRRAPRSATSAATREARPEPTTTIDEAPARVASAERIAPQALHEEGHQPARGPRHGQADRGDQPDRHSRLGRDGSQRRAAGLDDPVDRPTGRPARAARCVARRPWRTAGWARSRPP